MLNIFISLIGIIITILLVVGIHEFGHFSLAKLLNVKVLRFSIGFGKPLYRWYGKSGTEYVIAAIPLGGYVKMLDEHEENVKEEDLPYSFNRQPLYKRFAIVIAGPIFNLLFAFVIYWALYLYGFISIIPIIGNITPHTIAAASGIPIKQEITQINRSQTPTWESVVINLLMHVGNNEKINLTIKNPQTNLSKMYSLDLASWHLNTLRPDPLESLGIVPYEPEIPAVIGKIYSYSPAQSKLQKGDTVLAVNNQIIHNWIELTTIISQHPDTLLHFKIKRAQETLTIPIKTAYERDFFFNKHGVLGVSPEFKWPKEILRLNKYGPIDSLKYAWKNTFEFTYLNFVVFEKLLTGKISFQSLGGPITIFESAGTALNNGIIPFLAFLAFLSISIGLINILPIPGLDGGHLLFQAIELIIRRPVSLRVQMLLYRLGFIVLLLLITKALINDFQRLG